MLRTYRKTKESFVKKSNKPKQCISKKVSCYCNKYKNRMVDPYTEKNTIQKKISDQEKLSKIYNL